MFYTTLVHANTNNPAFFHSESHTTFKSVKTFNENEAMNAIVVLSNTTYPII